MTFSLKNTLALLLCLAPLGLKAGAYDEALAAAKDVDAHVQAASSVHSPSVNNFQKVKGDLETLPPFFSRLANSLAGVNIGPASEIRSIALDLNVKIGTVSGLSVLKLDLFLETCKNISGQFQRLEGLLPGLIQELSQYKEKAIPTVAAATGWTPPPSAPVLLPEPTPALGRAASPTPGPAPTQGVPASPPSTGGGPDFGVIPGGPSLPPPTATPAPQPSQGAPTPTPLPPLKVPVSLAVDSSSKKVYVANVSAGTVSVLDSGTKRFIKEIAVGPQPSALALSNDQHLLVVACYGSASAVLIDTRKDEVVATLKTGDGPVDLGLSSDGKTAFVVCQAAQRLTVLDLKKRLSGKNLKLGARPSRIEMGKNSKYAYVSNSGEDSVSIVDTDMEEVIAVVQE